MATGIGVAVGVGVGAGVGVGFGTGVGVGAIVAGEEAVSRKDLSKAAGEQFTRSALLGEVERPEASNPVTFQNAVDLLVRHRVLAPAEEGDGFLRGEAFDDLPALRERLATALAAR